MGQVILFESPDISEVGDVVQKRSWEKEKRTKYNPFLTHILYIVNQ